MEKILYSRKETAELLGVCPATVSLLVKNGFLPSRGTKQCLRIHRKDIEKLANVGIPKVWPSVPWPEERERGAVA